MHFKDWAHGPDRVSSMWEIDAEGNGLLNKPLNRKVMKMFDLLSSVFFENTCHPLQGIQWITETANYT